MKAETHNSALDTRPSSRGTCALCELALPRKPVVAPDGKRYCCHGCLHVAAILRTVGAETEAGRLRVDAARQHGLISAAAPEKPTVAIPAECREETRLRVEGMACPSCAWLVEALLRNHAGVGGVEVDFFSDTARVVFDLRKTSREDLEKAIAAAGYGLSALETARSPEERRELLRLAVAAFIGLNLMMLAWVGYDSLFTGQALPQSGRVGWLQLILALPVVTWAALPIYRRALAAIRHGRVVMETLLSLGIAGAFSLSLVSLLMGEIHVYLETATMLVAISLGGRVLERWLKRRAARSLTGVLQFGPTKARCAGSGRFASLGEFEPGAAIRVETGEVIPLDLRAREEVVVREGLLTGEPHPVTRLAGEVVLAGSTVERGSLIGRVERPAGNTVADAMRNRVGEALRRTDAGSRLADRLAQGFVPLVVLIALAAFAGHWLHGAGTQKAILTAVAVLVVACPCAFGVAASSALSLALLRLARHGILVKEPEALEALPSVDMAILDKTGTLTRGNLDLLKIGWLGEEKPDLLAAVYAMEKDSRHPVGVTLARVLPEAMTSRYKTNPQPSVPGPLPSTLSPQPSALDPQPSTPAAEAVIEVPGLGVTATLDDRRVAVGTSRLFAAERPRDGSTGFQPVPAPPPAATNDGRVAVGTSRVFTAETPSDGSTGFQPVPPPPPAATNDGRVAVGTSRLFTAETPLDGNTGFQPVPAPPGATRVWFGYAGEEPAGYIDLADTLRPEARSLVEQCRSRGIEMAVFSGDAGTTTRAIAGEAGIAHAVGDLRPEEKAEQVRALREQGRRVIYIGDGFNDAEALAAVDIGVAFGAAADLASLSAPVVVTEGDLGAVTRLIDTARHATRVMRGNFAWAFAYNIALLPVAAFGFLQPIYAAALMAISSLSVGLNSMRVGSARHDSETAAGGRLAKRREERNIAPSITASSG